MDNIPPGDSPEDSKMALISATSASNSSTNNIPSSPTATKRTRPTPSKTFQCRNFGDCRMVFSRSEHLARHIRKHTGERPFTCHCSKNFSRLDNLRQHAQTVHADKAEMNERMMRELGRVHASMAAANKQAAQQGGSTRSGRGSQDGTAAVGGAGGNGTRRSRARPGTSTGYEGAGSEAMYPGLAHQPNQLGLSGFPDLPDPYLVRKKEFKSEDGSMDGDAGPYSRNENGGYDRFHSHPHHHHPYNSYPYNSYNSPPTSATPYPQIPQRSPSLHGYSIPTAPSPSLSSSSSPSPVQDLESSYSSSAGGGGNFPYAHLDHLPLNSASASAPYLPLSSGLPMSTSPVTEMPPPMSIDLSGLTGPGTPSGRPLSSRTSHPHLHNLHIQLQHPPHSPHHPHPGSPYHSPPLSASHSGSSSGGYFPLVPVDSNERRHAHHSTSLPGTPFEGRYGAASSSGYNPSRVPAQGYTSSAAWVAQGAQNNGGGGGYWG